MKKFAIVGSSPIARDICSGLSCSQTIAENEFVRAPAVDTELERRTGTDAARATSTLLPSVANAGALVIACPAGEVDTAAERYGALATGKLLISAVPGISIGKLRKRFANARNIVRVALGESCRYGRGVGAYTAARDLSDGDKSLVDEFNAALGQFFQVAEDELNIAEALISSGSQLFDELAAAMVDSGMRLGLDPLLAHEFAINSLKSACMIMAATGEAPESLSKQAKDASAANAAALEELHERAFRQTVHRSIEASHKSITG